MTVGGGGARRENSRRARGEVGWLSRPVAQKVMRRMERGAEETCPLTEREMDVLQLL